MTAETINMRTDTERKEKLQQAAHLANRNLTAFILDAAEAQADEVIRSHRETSVPADFFDTFFEAIGGKPTSALEAAAARMHDVVTRGD